MLSDSKYIPKWRIALAAIILILLMGPFLFAMYYSYLTGTSFYSVIVKVDVYFPYVWILILIIYFIGFRDLFRKYR